MNISVIYEMIVLFILMLAGFILFKLDFLDLNMNKKLSRLILNVTTPALVLSSAAQEIGGDKSRVYYLLLIAVITYLLLPILAMLINKLLFIPKDSERVYRFMTVFSNIGFMGYPVIASIYGDGAIIYASIFNLVFNMMVFSYGAFIMNSSSKKLKMDFKLLINPGILSSIMALILFLLGIPMHYVVKRSLSLVGSLTSPLAMMIMGSTLGAMSIKSIFNDRKIYLYTAVRQLLLPIVIWLLLKIFVSDSFVLGLSVIMAAMPAGIVAIMFANEYKQDHELAARGVFITTLLSFITIPIITMLLH